MKTIVIFLLWLTTACHADTVEHYMNISNGIPQMEIKADPQSQAWARSARTVLTLTCDGILDSLTLANETAKKSGKPLFCLDAGKQISPEALDDMIQQTYKNSALPQSEKDKMTVSQIALIAIQNKFPCGPQSPPTKQPFQADSWRANS